jgi:replicative DNA helicase
MNDDRIVTSHEFYEEVKKLPVEKRYNFGIGSVDKITEGFTQGDLIVVSGFTGHGKTSICQTISYNLSQDDIPTLWFSFELSARQFFNKYKDKTVPLFYMPKRNKPYDLEWLDKKIAESKEKFGAKVVFIDHLHYIVPMLGGELKKSDLIGDTMRRLKQMAVKYEVVIFLMAHTKQPKDQLAPTLGDLRDSSFVGQESDAVYIIHRPTKRGKRDEFEDFNYFTVVKQRHTGVIGQRIKLEMHNKMFYDQINHEDEKEI